MGGFEPPTKSEPKQQKITVGSERVFAMDPPFQPSRRRPPGTSHEKSARRSGVSFCLGGTCPFWLVLMENKREERLRHLGGSNLQKDRPMFMSWASHGCFKKTNRKSEFLAKAILRLPVRFQRKTFESILVQSSFQPFSLASLLSRKHPNGQRTYLSSRTIHPASPETTLPVQPIPDLTKRITLTTHLDGSIYPPRN